jgi:hypothetical protein
MMHDDSCQLRTPPVDFERRCRSSPSESPQKGPVATYFQQPCPGCGRPLLILVEHLGQQVACSHCRRWFIARDVSQDRPGRPKAGCSILEQADRLLALLESEARNG